MSDPLVYLASDAAGLVEPETPEDSPQTPPAADAQTPPEASSAASPDAQTEAWRQDFSEATDPLDLLRRISKSVSREELFKDPTLAGVIGDTADKLQRKRQADADREAKDRADAEAAEERRRRLEAAADDDDLLTLGEIAKEDVLSDRDRRVQQNEQAERHAHAVKLATDTARGALDRFVDTRPQTIRTQLQHLAATKAYSQEFDTGFGEWLDDVVQASIEDAKTGWEKSLRQAVRQEVLGEIEAEQDGSPEVGGGSPASGLGLVTQAEWDANRHDRSWMSKNLERLNRSIAAGAIRD